MAQRPSSKAEDFPRRRLAAGFEARARVVRDGISPAPQKPADRAAVLQRRVRGLTAKLRRGEDYHVELDAIASELGILAMDLESYELAGRTWRAAPR